MAHGDPRYERVNALWATAPKLKCSREDAAKLAKELHNRFGLKSLGGPSMRRKCAFDGKVRRVWIDDFGDGGLDKGWQRLAHDVSHRINRKRHPTFKPHDNTQAILEYEIACFCVEYLFGLSFERSGAVRIC